MRPLLFCTVVPAAVVLSLTSLAARGQSQPPVTVSMRPYQDVRAIVAVKVNGAGPYDFLVDTGATTTVIEAALFQQLGLHSEGSAKASDGSGEMNLLVRSSVEDLSLSGLSVKKLIVVSLKRLPLGQEDLGVRGILGEDFLQHFDILIDNQHRKLILDAGSSLRESLDGERLPIAFPAPSSGLMTYRPMVSVTVPQFGARPVTVLLDSGADKLVLVGGRNIAPGIPAITTRVSTANGSMLCASIEEELHWGKAKLPGVATMTCPAATNNPLDHAGNLPTAAFRQLFISHSASYAIVDPTQRSRSSEEIAILSSRAVAP